MGTYLGFFNIKNKHYNFKPIAEIKDSSIITLTQEDKAILLPDSTKRDIDFFYPYSDELLMEKTFSEKSLYIFDFELSDLTPNQKQDGTWYPTGYKVQAVDLLKAGKIRNIHADNIYHVIRKENILSDFYNDNIVDVEVTSALPGEKVFVELDGFWAGPYTVGYRDYTSSYYIKPQIKENKYTVRGYKMGNYVLQKLTYLEYWGDPEYKWEVFIPKSTALQEQIDVIRDDVLIESFRDSLDKSRITNNTLRIDDIPALVNRYEEAVLSGDTLTDSVRRGRLNRLVDLLTSEEDVDDTISTIADFVCDLLVRQKDSPNVEEWLRALLEKHPDLIERLKESRAITEKIAETERILQMLSQAHIRLEEEIEKRRTEVSEINQAAIEAKKTELLQMDAEYADLCAKLDAAKKVVDVVDNIVELEKKKDDCQEEVNFLTTHKGRLETATAALELEFQQRIYNAHEKMVDIAFDGFMASKMLRAAAEWEAEDATKRRKQVIAEVNEIFADEKSPKELIEYLCRTIQTVRPKYTKNTIINIAICMTQGFLTVFSGEPGCGKTSICNIFGEALGLNKIKDFISQESTSGDSVNRYVPVSVERGWTSKRDFVGYFNPLSKTFDKSNRRVYDALQQLDGEKRENTCKLPYIILLDEANLSPMEYYWSDFMNICDDLGPQSQVNLGEDYVFAIPETLHFLATINNDHTTETLSPRLIDRAWIISLPQQHNVAYSEESMPSGEIEIITWKSLCEAFIPRKEECKFSAEVQRIYDALIVKLREKRFTVSPRIDKAIKRYWATGQKHFEKDETGTEAEIVALDYAVSQRILPKIAGSGEPFEKWLEEFKSLCSNHGLNMSANILKDIIDRGKQQMNYYQFFC